jgi:nucleoside-diphosphate-sugar epimerase
MAVRNHEHTYGEVFIAADDPIPVKTLVDHIVAVSGLRRKIPRIPVFLGVATGAAFDVISKITGKSLPLSVRRVRAMTRDIKYTNKKLTQVVGVRPQYGVLDGITRAIIWYRQAGLL